MQEIVKTVIIALVTCASALVFAVTATAAPAPAGADTAQQIVAVSAASPSPTDTVTTNPANPGTGETAEQEGARLDYAPWVIGAAALATLVVVLVWRRRRDKTIV